MSVESFLRVCIVQPDIAWEAPGINLKKYDDLISSPGETDLIVLPEMFTTGFSMNSKKLAMPADNEVVQWMKDKASLLKSSICGSLIISDRSSYYNRFYMVYPGGKVSFYNKRHMFRMGGENESYSSGQKREVFSLNNWRICPQVCYDLRFPVWSRNRNDYDLLLYVANWPAKRSLVWNTLLRARAIENQAFVIGVNRTGSDGEGIDYRGQSQVIDPRGNILLKLDAGEQVSGTELSLQELNEFRKKFPVWKDRDNFSIDI